MIKNKNPVDKINLKMMQSIKATFKNLINEK